jgi:elongation factor G
MKNYATADLRDVVVVGHGGSGKTSLVEAMLYNAKATTRLGKVESGSTVTDFEPEEIKRKISISLALAPCEWKNCKLNLIDTPGYADFIGEVVGALRAADSVLTVVDAAASVEVQTEKIWDYVRELNLPGLFFVNGMSKENADFSSALTAVKERLNKNAAPLQLPIGKEASFKGVVDLLKMKAVIDQSGQVKEEEIPEDMKDQASDYREKLVELIVEADDKLLEKYLEGEEISAADLNRTLKLSVAKGHFTPVLCGSAAQNISVQSLLDTISDILPSPEDRPDIKGKNPKTGQEEARKNSPSDPLSALVFKTVSDPYVGKLNYVRVFSGTLHADSTVFNATKGKKERVGHVFNMRGKNQEDVKEVVAGDIAAIPKIEATFTGDTLCDEANPIVFDPIKFPEPVYSLSVEPKTRGDEERMSTSLTRLADEDPTFKVRRDHEIKQTIISGIGDLHLEIMAERLKRKFGVDTSLDVPRVPYKETVTGTAKAQGKYKKQTGGRGQYGDVWLGIEPLERGKGFEFVDKIFGGAIPRNYVPAVEKGIKDAILGGVLAGYPVVDVKVTLYDGSFHPVDSSDMAFKIAGSLAFKKSVSEANPILLEPIMNVEVVVPEVFMGDVIGDLNSKRGRILGMEPQDKSQIVRAQVPLAEMGRYATELRSITRGQGTYKMSFFTYEPVPVHVAEKIIEQKEKEKEKVAK